MINQAAYRKNARRIYPVRAKRRRRILYANLGLVFVFGISLLLAAAVSRCSSSDIVDSAVSKIYTAAGSGTFSKTTKDYLADSDGVKIVQQFAENNDCYITNEKLRVKGLMLHSVGVPQSRAEVFARNYNEAFPYGNAVCPHAFLQADGTVYQILPWDMAGWHAGGDANQTHIGIEMCEPDSLIYTEMDKFYTTEEAAARAYAEGTYQTAVKLFGKLCLTYDLDPLEEGVIISHAEGSLLGTASEHNDPEHLWQGLGLPYTMDTFRADVAEYMASLRTEN